ncbi:MAG: ParB/RepB/Spo0J family partition protein [Brevundimonas sp.]|uniref:ParB/RepB/Spo0J family partition protein n=1 Tax=Brevundimonas sp. TaxID=1871086 RepID=UPI00273669C3|nr:ParB/RepB/Spo0J family partition protein [Brevundimonas sp.]MDP3405696.1 ParB/RepB/Spo0J family partition protein [Brevundimonas sp.]
MTTQSTQILATDATSAMGVPTDDPVRSIDRPEHGAVLFVPLDKLRVSPRNARKAPHSAEAIEALAGSIKAKGVIQPLVVEIEIDGDGEPTGRYLVTIGEGRRQALRLLAKRKTFKKTQPVRCIVDADNDAHEISLDENVTRSDMHPADQYEAFRRLAEEKGYGAEEIAARFGVSAQTVRQRLRLGAVAPALMTAYRSGWLKLDQLMAFGVSQDQDRQEQVLAQIAPHTPAYAIRRAMTETKVQVSERRVRFVSIEAYEAAGGSVLRDLFSEDDGGWVEDVVLLDRLVAERLAETASAVRDAEDWKWAEAHLDYPYGLGLGRVYPQTVERSEVEASEIVALGVEYDAILSEWDGTEDWPAEVEARFNEIDAALKAFGDDFAYRDEDRARAGVIVALGADGQPRIERGLVRAEDAAPPPQAEDGEADAPGSGPSIEGDTDGPGGSVTVSGDGPNGEPDEGLSPLSEKLVLDLTAWRTAGLRDAMASDPLFALTAVVHAMALEIFYPPYDKPTPLQFRLVQTGLERHAPGLGESAVGRQIADRHEGWATRLPKEATELWAAVLALPLEDQLVLLAHCASLGLNAVRDPHDRRPAAWAQAEVMATALALDMATIWTPSIDRYLGRVSKARILEAVGEAASPPDAERMSGWKKSDMADAAELLLDGKGWLPPLLRTAPPTPPQADGSADASETEATDRPEPAADGNPTRPDDPDAYPFAAE